MNDSTSTISDITGQQEQIALRQSLMIFMGNRPMALSVHARGIGIMPNSLTRFLKGGVASYLVAIKIMRYLEDNK